ncbi:porin family protein [Cyclobacterium xiamenense]|jgi:hypothetical protein|uniref:porin family protein n=1 Tax=Cyclobacterium xiamenense TaxID=1297121 RepID=UPI0012B79C7D|nr:porin family protein [Cyclobacterium xiamenense]
MNYRIKVVAFIGAVLFLSAFLNGYGQTGIRIGITGGVNANQIKTSTNVSNLLWKYNAGISGTKKISDNFALTSELSYSRQGRRLDLSSARKYVTNFDYLALPVLLRYSPGGKEWFIQAGGKFGLLVNSKETYIYNNNNSPNNLQHLRQWDAGALAGLGYRLGSHIVVDVRYYNGLTPLIKDHWMFGPDSTPLFYGADRWVHRVWSMNLTYYL